MHHTLSSDNTMPGRTFFHRAARASRAFPAMEQDGCSTTASPRHHHRHICRVHFPPSHDGTHAASLHQFFYLPPSALRGTHTRHVRGVDIPTRSSLISRLPLILLLHPSTPQFILCSPTSEAKKRLFHVFAYPCQRTILVPASLSVLGNDVCFETN